MHERRSKQLTVPSTSGPPRTDQSSRRCGAAARTSAAQAAGLVPTFHARCVRWAATTGGTLHEQGGGGSGEGVVVDGPEPSATSQTAKKRGSLLSMATSATASKGRLSLVQRHSIMGSRTAWAESAAASPASGVIEGTEASSQTGSTVRDLDPPSPASDQAAAESGDPALGTAGSVEVRRTAPGRPLQAAADGSQAGSRFALLQGLGASKEEPSQTRAPCAAGTGSTTEPGRKEVSFSIGAPSLKLDEDDLAAGRGAGDTAGALQSAALVAAAARLTCRPSGPGAVLARTNTGHRAMSAADSQPGPSREPAAKAGPGGSERLRGLAMRVGPPRLRWDALLSVKSTRRAGSGGSRALGPGPWARRGAWRVAWARAGATALLMQGTHAHAVQSAVRSWIATRFVKSPLRAAAKAASCYRGDVSWLLDVCRARIAFRSVDALADCVRAVADAAPAARVVRVRNLLSSGDDAWSTAGFRVRSPRAACPHSSAPSQARANPCTSLPNPAVRRHWIPRVRGVAATPPVTAVCLAGRP